MFVLFVNQLPAKNEHQRLRNEAIIKRMAELGSRQLGAEIRPATDVDPNADPNVDYVYLGPGEKLPPPKPGRTQIVIKRELVGPKVEVNTAEEPVCIQSSGDEVDKPTEATSVAPPVSTASLKPVIQRKPRKRAKKTHPVQAPSTSARAPTSSASATRGGRAFAARQPLQTAQAQQQQQYDYYDDSAYYDQSQYDSSAYSQATQYDQSQYYDASQYDPSHYDQWGHYIGPQLGQQEQYDYQTYDQSQYTMDTDQQPSQFEDDPVKEEEKPVVEGGADPAVGAAPPPGWIPPEFTENQRQPRPEEKKTATEVFEDNMKKRPWATDAEELELAVQVITRANLVKSRDSTLVTRPCWLRLRRKWLLKNFLKHFLSESNIRYKKWTFASLCHHPTTSWDCHPVCWQCYAEYDLPLCGLDPEISCEHCRQMGPKAVALRNKALRAAVDELKLREAERKAALKAKEEGTQPPPPSTKKSVFRNYQFRTGLPHNIFDQHDADVVHEAKGIKLMPNPDWFNPKNPVGSCFPSSLIRAGQTVAQAVAANPQWQEVGYLDVIELENRKAPNKKIEPTTPSTFKVKYAPACLMWGTRAQSERDEHLEATTKQLRAWSESVLQRDQSLRDSMRQMRDSADIIQQFSKNVMPQLQKLLPTPDLSATPEAIQEVLSTLTNKDIEEALSADVGAAAVALEKADDIDTLTKEQMAPILRKLMQRATTSQQLVSQANTPRQSRASSEERRQLRKTPTEARQEKCAAVLLYEEKKMLVSDWSSDKPEALNAGAVQREPYRSEFVQLLDDMRDLNLDVEWEERYDSNDEGESVKHFTPVVEPAFLAQHWFAMAALQYADPFHIQLNFPGEIGYGLGIQPHLLFKPLIMLGDQRKKFPTEKDVVPVRQGELDLARRLTAATAAINNIVAVANRELSLRVEDLSTPLRSRT